MTDSSPGLMISPALEVTERSVQLHAGLEKTTKARLEGEALEIVKNAVLSPVLTDFMLGFEKRIHMRMFQPCVCVSILD